MATPRLNDLPHYTYDDYIQWEGRWELICGIAYAMTPAPGIEHQSISSSINWQLQELLKDCSKCRPLLPVDWKIDEETTVQPDNLVVCDTLKKGAYLAKAPALIFEILSKSTASKDRNTKYRLYEQEGVKHYIIVDPRDRIAKVYLLESGRYIKVTDASNETVDFDLGKCDISFDFSRIWF